VRKRRKKERRREGKKKRKTNDFEKKFPAFLLFFSSTFLLFLLSTGQINLMRYNNRGYLAGGNHEQTTNTRTQCLHRPDVVWKNRKCGDRTEESTDCRNLFNLLSINIHFI